MGSFFSKYYSALEILISYKIRSRTLIWSCIIIIGSWTWYSFAIKPFLSPLRKIPGPGYNPIFGNVREAMVGEAMDTSVSWVKKYGGIVHFYHLLGQDRVLVASPEGLRHIFVTNEHNYARNLGPTNLQKSVFGVTGTEHAAQRQLLNPLFTKEAVKSYFDVFQQCVGDVIDLWHKELSADGSPTLIKVQDFFSRMTLDVFGKSVLGCDIDSIHQPDNDLAEAFHAFTGADSVSFTAIFPFLRWLPLSSNKAAKKQSAAAFQVIKLLQDLVHQAQQAMYTGDKEQQAKTLLQRLILARDVESGLGLSVDQVVSQLAVLIFAGHETTSWTLSWILLTLASHPDVQNKVRDEVMQVLPCSGQITMDHLDKLNYTNAVIKECQRLYPVAPNFSRIAIKDDHIGPYFIPAGTEVIIHMGALMRNDEIWPEADKFKPERFLGKDRPPLYHYLPFATGPHTCLGINFARAQLRLALSLLIQQFQFSPAENMHFKRKLRVTLKSEPQIQLLVKNVPN